MLVSINQLLPQSNSPEVNFELLTQTVKTNKESGSTLSIFPEDYLYGVLRNHADLISAGKQFDYWVRRFQEIAIKYRINLVPGSFPSYQDGKLYNSTVYINSSGEILTQYSKCNLWLSERDEYTPSLKPPEVFDSVLGKTAIIICWDILDHELFRSAIKHGAEWIICVSFWSTNQSEDMAQKRGKVHGELWGYSDSSFLTDLVPVRSVEYGVGMIFCNFAGIHTYKGKTGTLQYSKSAGRSQITTPQRQLHRIIRNHLPATLTADVNLTKIAEEYKDIEIGYGRRRDVAGNYPYN